MVGSPRGKRRRTAEVEAPHTDNASGLTPSKDPDAAPEDAIGSGDDRPLEPLERLQLAAVSVLQRMVKLVGWLDDPKYRGFGTKYADEERYTMQIIAPDSDVGVYKQLIQDKWEADRAKGLKTTTEFHFFQPPDQPKSYITAAGRATSCKKIKWKVVLSQYLAWERTKTPFEWAGLEARPVPQTDPRVALRGQLGLYIRDGFQIEAGTVLGPYVALLSFEDEKPQATSMSEDLEEERYMFDFFSFGTLQEKWKALSKERRDLSIKAFRVLRGDGHKAGSIIRAANDYHFDPITQPQGCVHDFKENIMFVECLHRDWPYVFVVAKHRICAGEEVLLDYGDQYWGAYTGSGMKQMMFRNKCINDETGLPTMVANLKELIGCKTKNVEADESS